MPTAELVSVVMPILNAERFIVEAIRSVMVQTTTNWELLMVDDGSSDRSMEIARSFAEADSRIRLLRHPGGDTRGASASRNLGIAEAHGDYIALLDADDVWIPTKLAEQLACLDRHPDADAVYGKTLHWHSWTGRPEDDMRDVIPELGVRTSRPIPPPLLLERCINGIALVPHTSSLIVRREAVDRAGGFEEEFRFVYTDQAFFAKLFLKAPTLAVDRCWNLYRKHGDSSLSRAEASGEIPDAHRNYLNWLLRYLTSSGLEGGRTWRVVQREIRWREASPIVQRIRRFWIRAPRRLQRLKRVLTPRRDDGRAELNALPAYRRTP